MRSAVDLGSLQKGSSVPEIGNGTARCGVARLVARNSTRKGSLGRVTTSWGPSEIRESAFRVTYSVVVVETVPVPVEEVQPFPGCARGGSNVGGGVS